MFGAQVVVLLAVLACATVEGVDVEEFRASDLELLAVNEGAAPSVGDVKSEIAAMKAEEQEKDLKAARKIVANGQVEISKNRVELEKLEASATAAAEQFAKAKDPKKMANVQPADPALIAQKAETLSNLKEQIVLMKQSLSATDKQVKDAQSRIASSELAAERANKLANKEARKQKAEELMQRAESATKAKARALSAKRAARRDSALKLKQAQSDLLSKEKSAALTADENAKNVAKLAITVESEKSDLGAAVKNEKKLEIAQQTAKVKKMMADSEVSAAQDSVFVAQKAEDSASSAASTQRAKGRLMMSQAKELLKLNHDRVSAAKTELKRLARVLQDALFDEKMDKQRTQTTADTIANLHDEIKKIQQKKKLVANFGNTLKEKAQRDADAAQAGLAKAKADHQNAKHEFDHATKMVNKQEQSINKDESDRKQTISAIILALEKDDTQAAIKAGENYETLQKFLDDKKKLLAHYDSQAKVALAKMSAAKREEESALSLQLSSNKQFNRVNSNDEVLAHQDEQLRTMFAERKVRQDRINKILSQASKKVQRAEQAHRQGEKVYESRLAAQRYIKDVKMVVAQKLLDQSTSGASEAEEAAKADADAVASDQQKLLDAEKRSRSASQAAVDTEGKLAKSEQAVKQLKSKLEESEKTLALAKISAKTNAQESQVAVDRAREAVANAKTAVKAANKA